MTSVRLPLALHLHDELSAIAGDELADVLASWPALNDDQRQRLAAYLTAEMGADGLLGVAKLHVDATQAGGSESDFALARNIRREARTVLRIVAIDWSS